MKFFIQSKGDEISNRIKQQINNSLNIFGLTCDEEEPDIVISVGGDGTLLHAFHRYVDRLSETAFVGVHTGHLGFYADWTPEEVEKLLFHLAKTTFQVVEYPLLEVNICFNDDVPDKRYLALNECTIKSMEGSLVIDVIIKGDRFETFRGDGLCLSTPTGSTAYNKALNGAILHPSLSAIQLAEMASINNRVFRTIGSPLVLPEHHTCTLNPVNDVNFDITIDHLSLTQKDVKSIRCNVAKEHVRFARLRPFPFWKRVRESFVSG